MVKKNNFKYTMKVIFHDNSLCMRGTTVALFDYAYFCKHMFNIECSIMYNNKHFANNELVVNKFKKEFNIVKSYNDNIEMQNLIDEVSPDAFFMVKGGKFDNIISRSCKNWINACSIVNKNDAYGDKFLVCSKWLSDLSGGLDYVPYMINLPDVKENLRDKLGIPKDAVVIGRNGGNTTFDLDFAKKSVIDSIGRKDLYFLFQGTDKFFEHERVIWLDASPDLEEKVKFINTCDALLHARELGESFGQTCAEFSSKNKPVMTWFGSKERNHIDILGDKGIYYNNYSDLLRILQTFEVRDNINFDCYQDYYPDVVMDRFKKLYLEWN